MKDLVSRIYSVSENKEDKKLIWKEILKNFMENGNISIDDIDLEHSWVPNNTKSEANCFVNFGNKFLYSKIYKCIKTNSIGFTFAYKQNYIIKPFKVVKHNWKYIIPDEDIYKFYKGKYLYRCKDCSMIGVKYDIICPVLFTGIEYQQRFMLDCNEKIIADII
jgi:hypothetical protein